MSNHSRSPLASILAPKTIAIVGASRRAGTIGHQVLANLLACGFSGAVYPVNPAAGAICGVRAYPSIAAVPDPIDTAVIVVPAAHVLGVAEECASAGVKGLIVISAGFRETGPEGAERERALLEIVRRNGMRMIGPNCMGVVNVDSAVSMNATFAPGMPPFGHAAFMSQSGALGLNVLDHAREYGIGIAQFVSVGNKADVSGNDLLLEWERDPAIRVILMYVESFGNPRRFLEIASRVTRVKPIVVVKSGRSRSGARAASSHTGALAASESAVDALIAQSGVLRASSVEELFDLAMAFESRAMPRSRRTAVVTNAGGPAILAADALEASGLELVELSRPTIDALRPLFPAEASVGNPLDMIASATPEGYAAAMRIILDDPKVDAVLPIFVPPFAVKQQDIATAIVSGSAAAPAKPVMAVLMGREGLPLGRAALHAAGIPAYVFPESAARALAALNRQREWAERPAAVPERLPVDRSRAAAIIGGARGEGRERLTEAESLDLLWAYGIPAAKALLARGRDDVARVAREVGFPAVLKIVSPAITHKSDVGGVRVGIDDEAGALAAWDEIMAGVSRAQPGARIDGVLVQRMVRGGRELITGISRDPAFGPLLMFGLGGTLVEAIRDVVFRLAPVAEADARDMMRGIRGAAVLGPFRGSPSVDEKAIAAVLQRLGQLAADFPEIVEVDVNPLVALPSGAIAADSRVRIAAAAA